MAQDQVQTASHAPAHTTDPATDRATDRALAQAAHPGGGHGFKDILREEWEQQRSNSKGLVRGTFRQQISMAGSSRRAEFWAVTIEQIRRVAATRREPTRVESFEDACQRLKLSPADLQTQFKQFRLAHWLCYLIGAAILLWSFWLSLNSGWIPAFGALLFSGGAMLNGYLYGFRAWQIQIRELAPLSKAIRRLDSYLVI